MDYQSLAWTVNHWASITIRTGSIGWDALGAGLNLVLELFGQLVGLGTYMFLGSDSEILTWTRFGFTLLAPLHGQLKLTLKGK